MSPAATDVRVVAAAYRALGAGDAPTLIGLLHPEAEIYHAASELPWGGSYHGIDGFKEFAGRVAAAMETTLEVDDIFDAGDTVVGIARVHGTMRATGKEFDSREVNVWRVRDGKITNFELYLEAPALLAALAGRA